MASVGNSCCAASFCKNYKQKTPHLSFFRFPSDSKRCSEWLKFVERMDLEGKNIETLNKNYKLCSEHFEERHFMNSSKRKLMWDAIPTIRSKQSNQEKKVAEFSGEMDISSEDQIIPISVPENSSNELSGIHGHNVGSKRNILPPSNPSPRTKKKLQSYQRIIRKYKSRYYNMKRVKCKKLKTDISSLLKKLPGITTYSLAFINCQIEMAKRKKQGFRYQEDMKSLALDIYFHSSKCYRMLSKMFKLPSVRSLQIWLKNVEMVPGFSLIMKHCLSKKVKSFDEISKFCTVVFDEISLKQQLMYNASRDMVVGFENYGHMTSNRIAGYGLVFMIRGIFHNWKLPIGYFFSEKGTPATKLKQLLFECMDLLHEIGLKLKAVICDQGCNNQSLFKMLGISLNKPHIKYHDENIHFLFDAPHLIKCIRNNLQKYGFSVGENEVSWNYIADIYERDKTQSIRALRKITDAHIYLSPFAKMKVKFATQVLSNSVASLICTHDCMWNFTTTQLPHSKFYTDV